MANKKLIIVWLSIVLSLLLALLGVFYWKNLGGIGLDWLTADWPAIDPRAEDVIDDIEKTPLPGQNLTDFPLKLPDGFSIEIFAKDLPGARVMAFDVFGNMWVSQTSEGAISLLYVQDGKVREHGPILKNLKKPHGLAFDPEFETLLYFAEENRISTLPTYSDGGPQKILDLPTGGGHFTRTVGIGPDSRLYISIGSSCNVCHEADDRRAKIFVSNGDGSDFKEYARGLRNSVFFTWHPETNKMWATEMGRDSLGDDIPPDEVNVIEEGKNYGWPNCYGRNIHDTNFDKNTYIRNPCMEPFEVSSHIDLQAHSAPLGLAFVPKDSGWPEEFKGDLIVAFHGSWNRSIPTGYKLVRIELDENGNYIAVHDFINGWLVGDGALGRPVDVKFGPDGNLYVSDDKAGAIYRIKYSN